MRLKFAKKEVVTEAAENRQRANQIVENAIVNVAIAVMTVVPAHVVEASHVVTESVLYVARHYVVALRNSFLFYFVIFSVLTIRLEITTNTYLQIFRFYNGLEQFVKFIKRHRLKNLQLRHLRDLKFWSERK